MIKFFRKIRQDLLSKGKTGKYFKYAIGEIILVVIGILIALQINNWNQSRQNQNLELDYLIGIKSNINDDIAELEKHFKRDTIKFDAYTSLVRIFNSKDYLSKKRQIISDLYITSRFGWFEGQNIVFENLKSSGKLNLIQSDTISNSIQKYYRFFDEVVKQEGLYNSQIITFHDRNQQYYNTSSFIEPTFDDRWNANTGSPNVSFLEAQGFSDVKPILIENISKMKSWGINAHKVRLALYNQAKSLNNLIEQYITEKK
jgi:hypothetical protein